MSVAAPDPNTTGAPGPRTALLLGATSDIGIAILAEMAHAGLDAAVLAARDPDAARRRVRDAAPTLQTVALAWDALEVEGHRAFVERAADLLDGIDVVICGVGVLGHHAGRSMGPVDVEHMVRTNFAGPAAALAAVAEHLVARGDGTIVVLSSVAGVRVRRSNYVYGSSKAGLDAFAQGLGDSLVETGVRCVLVRPGFVRSRMTRGLDPAPFSVDPATVARSVVEAVRRPGRETVWVPRMLGPMFAAIRLLPRSTWRSIAGDR